MAAGAPQFPGDRQTGHRSPVDGPTRGRPLDGRAPGGDTDHFGLPRCGLPGGLVPVPVRPRPEFLGSTLPGPGDNADGSPARPVGPQRRFPDSLERRSPQWRERRVRGRPQRRRGRICPGHPRLRPGHPATPRTPDYAPVTPDFARVAPDYAPVTPDYAPVTPDYARVPVTAPPAALNDPRVETAPVGTVTDEERTRYGVLLDRAAERGLLDSAEYEVRLRQLAEATTTDQMVAIVAELPAFAPQVSAPAPHQSRSAIQSASRSAAGEGHRRRLIIWVLMGVLVALALASLVILALSVGRLSRSRSSMPPPPPAATRPVSALRL